MVSPVTPGSPSGSSSSGGSSGSSGSGGVQDSIAQSNAILDAISAMHISLANPSMVSFLKSVNDPSNAFAEQQYNNLSTNANNLNKFYNNATSLAGDVARELLQLATNSNAFSGVLSSNNILKTIARAQETLQSTLLINNPSITLPPSFLHHRALEATGGSGAAGSGLGVAAGTALLDTTGVSTTLDRSIYTSVAQNSQVALPPVFISLFKQLMDSVLAQNGLTSGVPLVQDFTKNDPTGAATNPAALGTSVATTSATSLTSISQTNALQSSILNILTAANPTASPADLAAAAAQLTAGANLFLLQAGILQIAQATNNPQLLAQLIAALETAGSLQPNLAAGPPPLLATYLPTKPPKLVYSKI